MACVRELPFCSRGERLGVCDCECECESDEASCSWCCVGKPEEEVVWWWEGLSRASTPEPELERAPVEPEDGFKRVGLQTSMSIDGMNLSPSAGD